MRTRIIISALLLTFSFAAHAQVYGVNTGTPVDYLQVYQTDSINFRIGQYGAGYNPGGTWNQSSNPIFTGQVGLWSNAVNYPNASGYKVQFTAPNPGAVNLQIGGIFNNLTNIQVNGNTYTANMTVFHDGGNIKAGGGGININGASAAFPISNFRVLRPGGTPQGLTPEFANLFNQYAGARYMNGSFVNNNTRPLSASDIPPAGQNLSGGGVGDFGDSIHDQIAWTNQQPKAKTMFVNIPWNADASYITATANAVKNELKPGVQVMWEYGNEPWNFAFAHAGWLLQQGQADSAHSYVNGDNFGRTGEAYGIKSAQMMQTVRTVIPTAKGFLNSQGANQWFVDQAKNAINRNFGNGAVANLYGWQGISFYPADNAGALGSATAIFQAGENDLVRQKQYLANDIADAHASGLNEFIYETSPNGYLTSGQTPASVVDAFRADPRSGQLTTDMMNTINSLLGPNDGAMVFTVSGDYWPTQLDTLLPPEYEQQAMSAFLATHTAAVVPEPAALGLLGILGTLLMHRKRR